jgi:hypothetical protein
MLEVLTIAPPPSRRISAASAVIAVQCAGSSPRPSGEVLAGIAGALRLTDAESGHLHVLAGTAPARTGLHRRDVRPSILALLERLPLTAAFVTSAVFEVLARNDLAAALMEDFARLTPEHRNLARRAFLGPMPADAPLYGVSDGVEFRHHVVLTLRAALARYPLDPAVTGLIEELRDGSPEFARLWGRHDVQGAPMLTKTFRHPVVGEVTVDCDSLTLTDRDQQLVLYTASPGSRSAEALALLNVLGTRASTRAERSDQVRRTRPRDVRLRTDTLPAYRYRE